MRIEQTDQARVNLQLPQRLFEQYVQDGAQLEGRRDRDVDLTQGLHMPQAAPGFIGWLTRIARDSAEAGTEGGFLGFGGVKVSEAEKTLLARLDTVLGQPSA